MTDMLAFFTATVVVEFDDSESAAFEALQEYAADNDIMTAFELTSTEPRLTDALQRQIRDALCGDSNDAEHDALVAVAEHLGIHYNRED